MRSHNLLTLLASGGGALSSVARHECFQVHRDALAAFSDCGHHALLSFCFSQLGGTDLRDIETCFIDAGCSEIESAIEAPYALERCDELSRTGELRRRDRGVVDRFAAALITPAPVVVALDARADATAGPEPKLKGTDCFKTSTIDTSSCPLQTDGGKIKTLSCFPTQVAASDCAPGLMCTTDANHEDICMKMQNSLDTSGIIIAIVFGVAISLGLGALTFLCCRDRRQQKRLAAKAEAVALARAETKRQKAREQRAPLMRQQEGAPGSPNPFHDGNQG